MKVAKVRRMLFAAILLASFLMLAVAWPAAAGDTVSIISLIENMKKYDGKVVTIKGEVIGDLQVRGDNAWITVNDDVYSKKSIEEGGELVGMSNVGMGVWLPKVDTRDIAIYGGYKNKGDKVRLTGVFHRACPEHGGDTDIHANSLEVLSKGYPFDHGFPYGKALAVIILGIAIGLLWYWRDLKRKKYAKEE